jgi:hypothetical protein
MRREVLRLQEVTRQTGDGLVEKRPDELPKTPAKSGCCGDSASPAEAAKEKEREHQSPAEAEPKEESCCCG